MHEPAFVEACRQLLTKTPNPGNVARYARLLFNVPVPEEPFHDGHDSPAALLRAVWGGERSTVTIASRGGYKTLCMAVAEMLVAHYQRLTLLHFAAGDDQVRTAINYFKDFCDLEWWRGETDFGIERIQFSSGGCILPRVLSRKNVRSKHVPRVVYDESDEMDPVFYKASLHICDPTVVDGETVKGLTHHISTHNRARGIVDTLRTEAESSGRLVMQWDYKDVSEPCPESRRGTGRRMLWVNPNTLARSESRPAKEDGWLHVEAWDGCPTCALAATCRGDLAHARGAKPIEGLLEKIADPLMTAEDWHSQQENLRPSTVGLAVPEWDERVQVTESAEYDPELPYTIGVDFSGGVHLAAIVAAQKIPLGYLRDRGTHIDLPNMQAHRIHVFDELTLPGGQFDPTMCEMWTRDMVPKYGRPSAIVADPSQLGNSRLAPIGGRRIHMQDADHSHDRGYRALRKVCVAADAAPVPPLRVHPRCVRLIHELGSVRKKLNADGTYSDQIDKRDDDALDAARYVVLHLLTRASHAPIEAARAEGRIAAGGLW